MLTQFPIARAAFPPNWKIRGKIIVFFLLLKKICGKIKQKKAAERKSAALIIFYPLFVIRGVAY